MSLASDGLCEYFGIHGRPVCDGPNGKRLAVDVALNLEHFALDGGVGAEFAPSGSQPDVLNYARREWGIHIETLLDNAPASHHDDPVADQAHHILIVDDEEIAHAKRSFEIGEDIKPQCLRGHIERSGRFLQHQKVFFLLDLPQVDYTR